jgi:hypothetical protein
MRKKIYLTISFAMSFVFIITCFIPVTNGYTNYNNEEVDLDFGIFIGRFFYEDDTVSGYYYIHFGWSRVGININPCLIIDILNPNFFQMKIGDSFFIPTKHVFIIRCMH